MDGRKKNGGLRAGSGRPTKVDEHKLIEKLDNLINSSSKGLDTKVGEFGDRVSGGQRQRIAIARALYKDPSVLILDECTNSLDLNTEKQIINEVNSFKGKKTILMITHRLSTLDNCDHIYKIDKEGIKLEKI